MTTFAFDDMADSYDRAFTQSALGRVLRELVWSRLGESVSRGQRVLELGCGTGEDALWLAGRGVEVVATDASMKMIEQARAKQALRTRVASASFHCMAMEDLSGLASSPRFDAVVSNFGAVNCVGDVAALADRLAGLLLPDARLFWVVMGRHVPWEWLWYLVRGQPRKAFRRYRSRGTISRRGLTLSYPTPGQLAACWRPDSK
ncbi:MAG: methyltransferase domain-containing protein [Steroidobacteraceae bacterium]